MQNDFTVCFFGHRRLDDYFTAEERMEKLIRQLMLENEDVEFLVGREGEYDQIVSSAVRRVRKELSTENCWLTWVLPYLKAELDHDRSAFEDYYDSIEICEVTAAAHPKAAIQIRNRALVDRSDLCVFFVEHPSGGAWKTLRYAASRGKALINLAASPAG